jgi:hypothetical protein
MEDQRAFPRAGRGRVSGGPLRELVVLPRTAELQAAEDALSLALVATVGGMRPPVSTAKVREHLAVEFGIAEESVSVRRHVP